MGSNSITDTFRDARAQEQTRFRTLLSDSGVSRDVIDNLLADGSLGSKSDLEFLRQRQSSKADPNEGALLRALEDLDKSATPAPASQKRSSVAWSEKSQFKAPDFNTMTSVENGQRTIKQGDGGAVAGEAWDLLNRAGYAETKYGRDERFGPAMAAKVREFQTARGDLKVTGEIDKDTLKALREAGGSDPAREVATTASAPLKRSLTDWVVTEKEARTSIDQLSKYEQGDLNRIAQQMEPKLMSRMIGELSTTDRAQYKPTLDRLVTAQNGRREAIADPKATAAELKRGLYPDGRSVVPISSQTAIDRLSRMNDADLASVTEGMGADAVTRMMQGLSGNDRALYQPTIDRIQGARNKPRATLDNR